MAILREMVGALGSIAKLAMDEDGDDVEEALAGILGPATVKIVAAQNEALTETRTLLLMVLDHWSGYPDWWRERAEKAVFPLGRPAPVPEPEPVQ